MRKPLAAALALIAATTIACRESPSGSTSASPGTPGASAAVAPSTLPEPPVTPPATDAKLKAAVAGPQRLEKETARDPYLHPVETLEFFGLRDDATVVELTPYRGQWTAVLAPVLAEKGHLRLAIDRLTEGPQTQASLAQRIAKDEAHFGKPETVMSNWAKCDTTLGPDGSADMVVTFRNMHDWLGAEVADRVVLAVHRVLKPGGIFALTDHRAKPGAPTDPDALSDPGGAYVPEDFMIAFVEKAGFRLVGKSEINANPKDTKDYPQGALTLPPWYALGDKDRAKYAAIGESDCMTLKFQRL